MRGPTEKKKYSRDQKRLSKESTFFLREIPQFDTV